MKLRAGGLVLAAGLLIAGCSDLFPPTAPGGPSDVTITGSVEPYDVTSHVIQFGRDGTFSATLTWSSRADLDLYLTPADCSGYPLDNCIVFARSTSSTGNSEHVEWQGRANEQYRVWVDNFTPGATVAYSIAASIR